MAEEVLIDWTQLDLIRKECGPEIDSIFGEFITECVDQFPALSAFTLQADAASLAKLAHQMKGNSATFGMARFAARMKEIERNALQGRLLPRPGDLEQLRSLFDESVSRIQVERPDLNL